MAMKFIFNRFPKVVYVCFLLFFLYIPTLNYRNTLIDVYANSDLNNDSQLFFAHTNFPVNSLIFHPAIFATTIALKKSFFIDSKIFVTSKDFHTVSLDPKKIIPSTGVSRVFLLHSGVWQAHDANAHSVLKKIPDSFITLLYAFTCLAPFFLMIFICTAK